MRLENQKQKSNFKGVDGILMKMASFYLKLLFFSCLGGALGGLGNCQLLGAINSMDDVKFCGFLGIAGGVFGGALVGFVSKIYSPKSQIFWVSTAFLVGAACGSLLNFLILYEISRGLGGLSG